MKKLNVELTIDEITTIIYALQNQRKESLRVLNNKFDYPPSFIHDTMVNDCIIANIVNELKQKVLE